MRSLGVLVLVGALLALLAGCNTGVSDQDVRSEDQSKGQQIEEATKKLMGGDIPADEYRD